MPDKFEKCLRVLGLAPGATEQAIKEAHRDLVKVWHPDRFGTDARLREKAQEKLKELNAAFDQLRAYRPPDPAASRDRQPDAEADAPQPRDTAYATVNTHAPVVVTARPKSWHMAATLIASAAIGSAGVWLLLLSNRPQAQEPTPASEILEAPAASVPAGTPVAPKRESAEPGSVPAAPPRRSPAAPTTGSLRVESQPMGARVLFDGAVVGETPIVVTGVTPGEHQVGVDLGLQGYQPWSSSVVVAAGRVEKLLAVMTPTSTRRR